MNVVKKKNYYYLKHSYRKGKKVITKDIYLGKEIPKNIEEIKKKLLNDIKKELYIKLNQIKNNYSKDWKKYPESIKKELLVEFSVNFTYNTNAIEGSTINRDETEDLIKRKISPNKPLRDVQESVKHSEVFLKMLNEKKELDLPTIIKWHHDIFIDSKPDIAGKIRDYHVKVREHICPDWQDLVKLMEDFFKWYIKNKDKIHPVELAALAHYRFVKIHPFGDGNGRVCRLITNFILNKKDFPLMIIEYKKRKSYYRALRKSDKEGESVFAKYFVKRYLSYYKKYLKK